MRQIPRDINPYEGDRRYLAVPALQCDPIRLCSPMAPAMYLVMRLLIDPVMRSPWKTLAKRTPNLSVAGR